MSHNPNEIKCVFLELTIHSRLEYLSDLISTKPCLFIDNLFMKAVRLHVKSLSQRSKTHPTPVNEAESRHCLHTAGILGFYNRREHVCVYQSHNVAGLREYRMSDCQAAGSTGMNVWIAHNKR